MPKIIIALCACLVLSGCTKQISQTEVTNQAPIDTTFQTIKEAVTKVIAIGCDYTDPDDGEQVKIFFKGQLISFRSGEKSAQPDIAGLIKENKIYFWNTRTGEEGLMIDLTKATDNDNLSIAGMKVRTNEDVINALEPHRKNCQPTSDLTVFELPANISFKSE